MTVGMLALGAQALAAEGGRVVRNATQVFTMDQLETGRGQLIASSEYQVALEFPREVQHAAVTISKQTALTSTAAGRVVYLDVAQVGGNATLNVMLTGNVLVQFDVALTSRRDGITRYRVVDFDELESEGATAPAVLPVTAAASTPARPASAPASPANVPASPLGGGELLVQTFRAGGVTAQFTVRREGQDAVIAYALTYAGADTVFAKPQDFILSGPGGSTLPVRAEAAPESSLLLARIPLTGRVRVTVPQGANDVTATWTMRALLSKDPITLTAKLAVTR